MKQLIFGIIILLMANCNYAATITAIASGSWTSNSTWSCNCQPTNADNIIIPAGFVVTDSGPAILFLGPVITITINGTLVLTNGGSLQVDASDIIKIGAGGKITGAGLGGGAVYSGVIPMFIASGTSMIGPETITNGTLPVKLLFFKGVTDGYSVTLTWASASEINFDYYQLDRSSDGIEFGAIAKVKGIQNSFRQINYSYDDIAPLSGNSYYRLRPIDLGGNVSSSTIVDVLLQAGEKKIEAFPNPATGPSVTARLNFLPEADGSITLVDSHGLRISEQNLTKDNTAYTFKTDDVHGAGVYFIIVKMSEKTITSKIIVP